MEISRGDVSRKYSASIEKIISKLVGTVSAFAKWSRRMEVTSDTPIHSL